VPILNKFTIFVRKTRSFQYPSGIKSVILSNLACLERITLFDESLIYSEFQLFAEELYEDLTLSFLENFAKELGFVQRNR
jgi:hypothetical protein